MSDIIKALNETTDANGGYLVPDVLADRVYELIQRQSIALPYLEQVTMTSDTLLLPKMTSGTTAYWVAETSSITASEPAFGRITLSAKKVAGLVPLSSELLEDANTSVADMVVTQLARDLANEIDDEIFNGTGGTFSGLRYTGSFTNSVTCGASTNGGAISLDKLSDAVTAILTDNHPAPDVLFAHPRTVGALRKLTDGNGRPMFDAVTFGDPMLKEGIVGTVYGMKVVPASVIPIDLTYGTQGSCTDAVAGVSKQFGVFGNRRKLEFHKDYVIDSDYYKLQANMRCAFAIKYANAYCVIRAITE